jgi:hypothetical protein
MLIWSERRDAHARELFADMATVVWTVLWVTIAVRIYSLLSQLAETGRLIRDGGRHIGNAGERIGQSLQGIPLIGEGAAEGVRGAFDSAANPIIDFGTDLERLLIIIALLIGLLVAAVALTPWLQRYLPWRVARWRRLNAGANVIRRRRVRGGPPIERRAVEQLLASRALHRLEFDELLEWSPDPVGDWVSGRYDRLAQAELDRVGLAAA